MKDDTIKVEILKVDKKNNKKLSNAEFTFKLNGKKIATVKTNKKGIAKIYGKLIAGKTYTVEETKAPKGYKAISSFKYKVKDTGKIQTIKVADDKIIEEKVIDNKTPSIPKKGITKTISPKTGDFTNPLLWIMLSILSIVGIFFVGHGMRKKEN